MAAARKKPTAEGPVPRRLWIMPPLALGAGGRAFGNRCQLQQCDLVAMAPQVLEAESMEHEDLPGVRDHLRLVQHEAGDRSVEHTSELQSLMRNSYAVFCLQHQIFY